jgi:folate-dependent phosphoribosylglycinamide formyltransferase PurN
VSGRILLLASEGPSSRVVYHALRREFGEVAVVLEDPVPRREFLRRRVARLGAVTVAGQVAFMTLALPLIRRAARARIDQIRQQHGLNDSAIPEPVERVASINTERARELIRSIDPSVVVVNGTRIIGREALAAIRGPVINTHAGITPLYRGVHGGYWALAEGRPELAGTTVHFVDEGIDTGNIIAQAVLEISPVDSFATYPYLHIAAGLPILLRAVRQALAGELTPRADLPELPSRLRSHPTLWGYVARRVARGVR